MLNVECNGWTLLREVGRGAYGAVYLAENADGRRAAVKVCRRDEAGDERCERELRGAKLYSKIPAQEGLARVLEVVEQPWGFYSVMELADDEFGRSHPEADDYRPKTLASVIQGEKALPLKECVKLAISLAKGLVALQRHHLLHRDIKPANVLYVGGKPVLSDPGLVVEESVAVSTVGTPDYLPPERKFTGGAGDIYSLGLTLKAASFGRKIEEIDKGPAFEADTGAPLFPVWWRILNKATDSTPSRRHQSAKALLKDIEGLRRKIAFAPIVGSSAAKGAVALVLLGIVAVVSFFVISSEHDKSELAKRSEENRSLKDIIDRQSRENTELKGVLDRQSEENKALKDDVAKQSEEIKSLKDDIANHPVESKSLTEEDVGSLKGIKDLVQKAQYVRDAKRYLKDCVDVRRHLYLIVCRLNYDLKSLIDKTSDKKEKEKLTNAQAEISELKNEAEKMLGEFFRLQAQLSGSIDAAIKSGMESGTMEEVEKKVKEAQKNISEGVAFENRVVEAGKPVYGDNWERAPKLHGPCPLVMSPEETSIMLKYTPVKFK